MAARRQFEALDHATVDVHGDGTGFGGGLEGEDVHGRAAVRKNKKIDHRRTATRVRHCRPPPLQHQKRLHIGYGVGARKWRQRFHEGASIAFVDQPRVAQHQHATVGFAANESTHALLERDHRLRQLLVAERVAALAANRIQARFEHRVVGRGERQLVDHHHAQGIADHVHALAETGRAQQHTVTGIAEAL